MFKTALAGTLLVSALGAAQTIAAADVKHIDEAFKVASSSCHTTHQGLLKLTQDRIDIVRTVAQTGMRPDLDASLAEVDAALYPYNEDARHPECVATIQMFEGLVKQEVVSEPVNPDRSGKDFASLVLEHGDVCARRVETLEGAVARRKKVVDGMKKADGVELSALDAELIAIDTQIALDLAAKRDGACVIGTVAWTEDPAAWRAEQCMMIAARIGQIEERLAPIGAKIHLLDGEITASSMMCATATTRGFCMAERQERASRLSELEDKRDNLVNQRAAQEKRARGLSCPGY